MGEQLKVNVRSLPLMIDTISVHSLPGKIGISSCPGMKMFNTMDLYEDRLENDLQSIRAWGAAVIITLLEKGEIAALGVASLPERALSLNLPWIHLPISNMGLPDGSFEEKWRSVAPQLLRLISDGKRVLIHCREGIGRSGVVATRLLIEAGVDYFDAIRAVRKARPGSLLLSSYEDYCYSVAQRYSHENAKPAAVVNSYATS